MESNKASKSEIQVTIGLMLVHLQKQFVYNAWANRETLASLERASSPSAKALRFFGHVLAAEGLWHTRLQHQSTDRFVVWPEWTLEECQSELNDMNKRWDIYLAGLTTEMLLHTISYVNTKGETWRNTVSDILNHVIIHSGYHRGQVAAELRRSGGEPAYTDYIHAVRQGFLEKSVPDAHSR